MARSHINPDTGEVGRCTATWGCPYEKRGDELDIRTHFNSVKDARAAGEKRKEVLFGKFSFMVKGKKQSIDDLIKLASQEKLTQTQLHELASTGNPIIVNMLSKRDNLDAKTVELLIQHRNDESIVSLFNGKLAKDVDKTLAKFALEEQNRNLDLMLMKNDGISEESLMMLVNNAKSWGYPENRGFLDCPKLNGEILDKYVKQFDGRDIPFIERVSGFPFASREIIEKAVNSRTSAKMWNGDRLKILRNASGNKNCPAELKKQIDVLLIDDAKLDAKKNPNISSQELSEIWDKDYSKQPLLLEAQQDHLRMMICQHPKLDNDLVVKIIKTGTNFQKKELMKFHQVNTPEYHAEVEKLTQLDDKNSDNWDIKKAAGRALAGSTVTPPNDLIKMANQAVEKNDTSMMLKVASNLNTPPNLLKQMSKTRLLNVKKAIAINPNTPADVLVRYSKMKNDRLLMTLGQNKKLPLAAQLNIAATCQNDSFPLSGLLKNPTLDPAVLDFLADSNNPKVVETVKNHPKTPMKTLLKISSRESKE